MEVEGRFTIVDWGTTYTSKGLRRRLKFWTGNCKLKQVLTCFLTNLYNLTFLTIKIIGIKLKSVNCAINTNISLEIKGFDSDDASSEVFPILKDQNNTVKKTIQIMITIVRSVFLLYPTLIFKCVAELLGRSAVFLNTSIFK